MGAATEFDSEEIVDVSPVGKFQIMVWLLGTSVIFIDGFNIQVMGYIMPQLIKLWHIPHGLIGPIVSSGLFGVFVGYLAMSPFANRVGHRTMLIWCTVLIGIGTIATTFASGAYSMMALRFFTGIALGASNPSAVLIISDFVPKRVRSTFIAAAIVGVSLGSSCAGMVAVVVLERFGWQGVLWVGGLVPLALVSILYAFAPNTFNYVINHKRDKAAALHLARRVDPSRQFPEDSIFLCEAGLRSASVVELLRSQRLAGTIGIWLSFSANLLVFFFIQSWLAEIVIQYGHSEQIAVTSTSAMLLGGIMAFFAIGPLMDRFQPYKVLAVYFLISGGMVALLGSLLACSVPVIMISAFLVGFTLLGVQKGMNAICVYFYPTSLRATGLGWGLGIGRLGAVMGPTVAGILMATHLPTPMLFYLAAAPMALGCLVQTGMYFLYGRRPAEDERLRPAASFKQRA